MAPHIDRLTFLPDPVLITILSLLPLKEAIQTSILAKPWRDLWRHRRHIDINEYNFSPSHHADETSDDTRNRQTSCIIFSRHWLLPLRNDTQVVSSFSLVFSNPLDWQFDMIYYIQIALDHRIKSLELDYAHIKWKNQLTLTDSSAHSRRFDIPNFLYSYQGLESLKLVYCNFRDDYMVNLGRTLSSLTLGLIQMLPNRLRNVLRSCPMLESLSLYKCFDLTEYVIQSVSLKRLRVDKCVDLLNLTVVAPNLKSFMYCGRMVQFGMGDYPLIEEVDLDFGLDGFFDVEKGEDIVDLLSKFYFAKSLRVCAYVTQLVPMGLDGPRLEGRPRAKELTIKTMFHVNEFCGILYLLNSYSSVERLYFEIGGQTIFNEDYVAPVLDLRVDTFWSEAEPLAIGCVKTPLKVVEIKGFKGTFNEINFLEFLVEHGRALRKLILRVGEKDYGALKEARILRAKVAGKFRPVQVVIKMAGYRHNK